MQIAATGIVSARVVDGVGEQAAISKRELVPDEVEEIDGLGDRFGWPATAADAGDEVEAELMSRTSSVRSARVIARALRCSKRSRFGTANPTGVTSFLVNCS